MAMPMRKKRQKLMEFCGASCLKSGATANPTADHIIPLSMGDSDGRGPL
jgi:hypothetical protein